VGDGAVSTAEMVRRIRALLSRSPSAAELSTADAAMLQAAAALLQQVALRGGR
jgi:hypothetical protein